NYLPALFLCKSLQNASYSAEFAIVFHCINTGFCPLVVRLLSALKADNKRTTSGQQADNKRTTTSVDTVENYGKLGGITGILQTFT
ncbi:MAG: hypothetical protein IKQ20_00835, partial [Bacteroidales bacterium]|nr:hypothetical protein [Bacteroidales bacterium]